MVLESAPATRVQSLRQAPLGGARSGGTLEERSATISGGYTLDLHGQSLPPARAELVIVKNFDFYLPAILFPGN